MEEQPVELRSANKDPEYLKQVGDYKPGTITKIVLHHFLTHSHVVIEPGPRLNMVVGANGTGKSTILNAICLGLGGDPKVLGRADDVRAFIQHGQDVGSIEITLCRQQASLDDHDNKREEVVLRRVLERNKGSERGRGRGASTFFCNGERVNQQEIKRLVKEDFQISIDNLCTFLPQDKVGSFSGLTDQERLIETEKTLARDQYLYKLHQQIQLEEETMNKDGQDVATLESALQKSKQDMTMLEREKARAAEREQALERADLLSKKLLWLKFTNLQGQAREAKEHRAETKAQLLKAAQVLEPLQEQCQQLNATQKHYEDKQRQASQDNSATLQKLHHLKGKMDKHDDGFQQKMTSLEQIDAERERAVAELQAHEQKHAELEETLRSSASKEQLQSELDQANAEFKESQTAYNQARRIEGDLRQQMQDIEEQAKTVQNKLARINDASVQKRECVFRAKPNLRRIYEWIEANRGQFRRRVWGPVACEVTTQSRNLAAYLEIHVPNRVLTSFVVETKADYDLLYSKIRNELQLPVNAILVENGQLKGGSAVQRPYSQQKMEILKSQHGIAGYLDETFTAPDAVLQALRDHATVHKVLVGGRDTQQSIDDHGLLELLAEPDRALRQSGLQSSCVFASQGDRSYRYTQGVSGYSKSMNSKVDDVGPAKMLAPQGQANEKERFEKELEGFHDKMNELRPQFLNAQKEKVELEVKSQELQCKRESSNKAMRAHEKMAHKVRLQEEKVKSMRNQLEKSDTKQKKEKMANEMLNHVKGILTALEQHQALHPRMLQSTQDAAGTVVNLQKVKTRARSVRETLQERESEVNHLKEAVQAAQAKYTTLINKLKHLKAEAEKEAPLEEYKEKLDALEYTEINEIQAALEEAEAIANGIDANPDAVRQYQKIAEQIKVMEANLQEMKENKDLKQKKFEKQRQKWEKDLETNVSKINVLFSQYMEEMNCLGEVRLSKGESEDGDGTHKSKVRDWGIEILVSFRDKTKAQVLSAHRHSGGERSVSTILYLMALQDLMVAPFRCVDEINQGLDDRNERLVFRRIVENATCKPNRNAIDHSGQYFLITPKLLPNLTDMERDGVTLLFVFNGPENFRSPTEWNLDLLLNAGKKRAIEGADNGDEDADENSPQNRAISRKRRSVEK